MSVVTKPPVLDSTGKRIADALESMVGRMGTKKLTIIATADGGVAVTDQSIKIYNATSGELYGTVVYNHPTAVTVDLPDGFSYRIEAVCTLSSHYVSDIPSGIMTDDKTVTLTYKSLGSLSTLPDLKAIANQGLGKYVEIGTEVSFTHDTFGEIVMEVADFDTETDTFTLLAKSPLSTDMQFDAPEALLKTTAEMTAGSYTFKNGSTSYYFTLTQSVPSGGQVRATATDCYTYTNAYTTDWIEKTTVSTTAIAGATELGTCATELLNHFDRVNYGSNDYGESAIDQWLNADGYDWWTAQTMFDRPPAYFNNKGFLDGVPDAVLSVIDDSTVKCASQSTYCAPDSNHNKNDKYTLTRRFYLASETEVYGSSQFVDGSKLFSLYLGATNADRIKRVGSSARYWWLRSPSSNANSERFVLTSGAVSGIHAYNSHGVAAACKISKST